MPRVKPTTGSRLALLLLRVYLLVLLLVLVLRFAFFR